MLWRDYQGACLAELGGKYGKEIQYYAIDSGNFPPKALALFEKDGMKYAFTIGMGLFPQPSVDMHFQDYENYEHIELGFCYPSVADFDEPGVFSQISSIAAVPWTYRTFLGHRHTVGLQVNSKHKDAVLVSDKNVNVAQSKFLREQTIDILWIVPISHSIYENLIADPADYSRVEEKIANSDIAFRG